METEKQLIAKIRENRKILIDDVENKNNEQLYAIWHQIAKDCTLESAEVAEAKWKEMVNNYLKFLRSGNTFPHAHAMSFLQQHLISFNQSSSDDLSREEFDQLRFLFENDGCVGGGIIKDIAAEKQTNNVDVINIEDSPDSIKSEHSETSLPVPELVPEPIVSNVPEPYIVVGPIITSVVRDEQHMNSVVTPSKEDCIIKTNNPIKHAPQLSPIRMVLDPKSPSENSHSKISYIEREYAAPKHREYQRQPVAEIPSSGRESSDNSQARITQPYQEAPSLPLQQQQPVDVPSSPAPISVDHNESSGAKYKDLSPLELIFLGYAKTLEKMPPALRMQTRRKISEIIDEAELQLFQ